jgi:hypothetical protein
MESKTFKVAKTEQDIINHAEGKGSLDCALKGFQQGKPVLLCTPDADIQEVLAFLKEGER